MADENVISSFLVALGFKVDEAQHNRFQDALGASHEGIEKLSKSMSGVLEKFANLATAAMGAAIGLGTAIAGVSSGMGKLGFAADRIKSAPENIRALEYALRQVGGSAEEAVTALESLAAVQRLNPAILLSFGVKPGTDTTQALLQLGERWQKMRAAGPQQESVAVQEMAKLHIDERTGLRLADPGIRGYFNKEIDQQKRMGLDFVRLTEQGKAMERVINDLKQKFDDFGAHVTQTWGQSVLNALTGIDKWFGEHAPFINKYLDGMKTHFDSLTESVVNWYKSLSPQGQSQVAGAGVAAGLMGAGGLLALVSKIPVVGPMIAGAGGAAMLGGAILGLAHDYETWKETGGKESLINWSKWEPVIESAKTAIGELNEKYLKPFATMMGMDKQLIPGLEIFATFLAATWVPSIVKSFGLALMGSAGFFKQMQAINLILIAMGAWQRLWDPKTYEPENLPPNSPLWRGMSEEDRRNSPSSPENNPEAMRSPASKFWEWLTSEGKVIDPKNLATGSTPNNIEAARSLFSRWWEWLTSEGKPIDLDNLPTGSGGIDPMNLPPNSPLWRGLRKEDYPNHPLNNPEGMRSPASRLWNWLTGSGGTASGSATDEKKQSVRDSLATDLSITPAAASGIVSNLNAESGIEAINEKNPMIPNSRGGFGWAQWTGSRRDDFEAFVRANNLDPQTDKANYAFLVYELKGKYAGVLAQLRRGDITATEAANIVFTGYESGGDPRLEKHRGGHVAGAQAIANLATKPPSSEHAAKSIATIATKPPSPEPAAQSIANLATSLKSMVPANSNDISQPPAITNLQNLNQPAAMLAPVTPSPSAVNNNIDQSRQVTVTNSPTVNVTGVNDPTRAADAVDRSMKRETANLIHHMRTAYA